MKYYSILFLALLFISCRKKVSEVDADYIGIWEGADNNGVYSIRIDEQSNGRYSFVGESKMDAAEGKARINNSTIIISFKRLSIDSPPTESEGNWTMVIDGISYQWLAINE